MANLDQIADFVADKLVEPFSFVDTVVYTSLNAGWTAPNSGFLVFTIEPSNSSYANAYIQDLTDNIKDLCKIASTSGGVNSVMIPVIKNHVYKIRSSSSNVQADARCYGRYYKIF